MYCAEHSFFWLIFCIRANRNWTERCNPKERNRISRNSGAAYTWLTGFMAIRILFSKKRLRSGLNSNFYRGDTQTSPTLTFTRRPEDGQILSFLGCQGEKTTLKSSWQIFIVQRIREAFAILLRSSAGNIHQTPQGLSSENWHDIYTETDLLPRFALFEKAEVIIFLLILPHTGCRISRTAINQTESRTHRLALFNLHLASGKMMVFAFL